MHAKQTTEPSADLQMKRNTASPSATLPTERSGLNPSRTYICRHARVCAALLLGSIRCRERRGRRGRVLFPQSSKSRERGTPADKKKSRTCVCVCVCSFPHTLGTVHGPRRDVCFTRSVFRGLHFEAYFFCPSKPTGSHRRGQTLGRFSSF